MKEFLVRFIPYIKGYKKEFIIALIGMVMFAVATSATAYMIKPILDDIFINKDIDMLHLVPFALIVIFGLKGFGRFLQSFYMAYIGQSIIRKTRNDLLSKLLSLDLQFFNKQKGGELISRVTNDIAKIQTAVSIDLAAIIRESITIVALLFVVIYQSPKLAFYGLVLIPLALYPLSILARRLKKLSHMSQEGISDITVKLSEIFNNIEIIKAYLASRFEINKFKRLNYIYFRYMIKSAKTIEFASPILEILGAVAVAGVIVIGGTEVIEEKISVGSFFSFLTALFMLYTPLKTLSNLYNRLQEAIAASERIFDVMTMKSLIKDGTKILSSIDKIQMQNVELKYEDNIALQNINLSINRGDTIALVGKSGAGKSSFINLIIRFFDTSSGSIIINNDVDIKEYKIQTYRSKIALVSQRIFIFNDSISANVAYGKKIDRVRVIQALKDANAWEFIEKLEEGVDTILDEFGLNLSGGQRQRISIARALYIKPDILIFDEATSALDNRSEKLIQKTLAQVSKDKITFIIAHRLSTIKNADKILLFDDGKIICSGTESELLKNCEEYRKLSEF